MVADSAGSTLYPTSSGKDEYIGGSLAIIVGVNGSLYCPIWNDIVNLKYVYNSFITSREIEQF